jgi:hypothetical protein
MRTCNPNCRSMGFRDARDNAASSSRIAPIVFALFIGATAHADDVNPIQNAEIAEADACHFSGVGCPHGPGSASPTIDPCYIAQNAMRPCASERHQPPKPVGVDPETVGTWELPQKDGPWVWEIHRDGTYRFHSEARDGAPPHAGTFSANKGQWSLKATTGYTDSGTYLIQPPDTLIATGQLGTAAWRHHVLKSASSKPTQ